VKYEDLMCQLEKASAEVAACPRLRAIAESPVCFTCQGRKGYATHYGDNAGWHECSSCDGTGLKRTTR
jgi:hypothetical protein